MYKRSIYVKSVCKRHLLLGRKANYDKTRQHIKNQRQHFADKGLYSQSYGFSSSCVWMWKLDFKKGWVLNNWSFQIVVLERLCRVLWTARRSNQSMLKETNPEYSLVGLLLKLQSFGHVMGRADSLEKTLILEKIEVKRRRGWPMMRLLDNITKSMDMNLTKLQEIVEDRVAKSQTWLSEGKTIET